jgi:hypothetical protein
MVGAGDVASTAVRTLPAPTCPVDAWLTLSAGSRVVGPRTDDATSSDMPDGLTGAPFTDGTDPNASTVNPADDHSDDQASSVLRCRPIPQVNPRQTARDSIATVPVDVTGWAGLTAPDETATGTLGRPGTLGDALAQAGQCSVAIGPGAAAALARSDGSVDRFAPALPRNGAPAAMIPLLASRLTACPVTVIDLGQLPGTATERAETLAGIDANIGALTRALPASGRLIVAGIADTPLGSHGLQAAIERRPATVGPPAWLWSESTHNQGMITTNDLAATIAQATGLDPAGFDGSPLLHGETRQFDTRATIENRLYLTTLSDTADPVMWGIFGILVLTIVTCAPLLLRGRRRLRGSTGDDADGGADTVVASDPVDATDGDRRRRIAVSALTVAALLPAAAPLATLTRWWATPAPGSILALAVVAGALLLGLVTWAGQPLLRRLLPAAAWHRPLAIATLTWIILTVDGLAGTPLRLGSPLSSGLTLGRFHGFDNSVFSVYAVSAVVVVAGVFAAVPGRKARWVAAGALAAISVLVNGLPMFGADAGGIVTLVPAFVVMTLLLAGQKIRLRHWLLAAGVTLAVTAAIALLAWAMPDGSHLGLFVQRLIDGDAWMILPSKIAGAWATVAHLPGLVLLVVLVALMWAVLTPGRRPWTRLQPLADLYSRQPALRACIITLVVVAVVGSLLNDSGIAVAAIVVSVAVGTLLTGAWQAGTATRPSTAASAPARLTINHTPTAMLTSSSAMLLVLLLVTALFPAPGGVAAAGQLSTATRRPLIASSQTVNQDGAAPQANGPQASDQQQDPLVIIGTSGIRWNDIRSDLRDTGTRTPTLARLLANGADTGAASLATGRAARCLGSGWLTLSAGRLAEIAVDRSETGPWACPRFTVTQDVDLTNHGRPIPGSPATITNWDHLQEIQHGSSFAANLGLLGEALIGRATDTPGEYLAFGGDQQDVTAIGPGAAVALADAQGSVPRYFTLTQALAPNAQAFTEPITLVDLGVLEIFPSQRADPLWEAEFGPTWLPGQTRSTAVTIMDSLLGRVLDAVPPEATVIVADVDQIPGGRAELGPVIVHNASGATARPRFLTSSATRTDGVVRLPDLTPLILDAAGAQIPNLVGDTPITLGGIRPSDADTAARQLAGLTSTDHVRRASYLWFVDLPFWLGLAVAALTATTAAVPALRRRLTRQVDKTLGRLAEGLLLTVASIPAASFLGGLTGWWNFTTSRSIMLFVSTAAATAAVVGTAALAPRRPVWIRPTIISGITLATLVIDAFAGTPLNRASPLGSAPTFGARFFGFGNPTFSVFAVAGIVVAAGLAHWLGRRQGKLAGPVIATLAATLIALVTTLVDVWPTLGADFGGIVLLPAFVVVILAATGARITLRRFTLWAAIGVTAGAGVAVLDWLRPAASRSHLGRFVQQAIDGDAWEIVWRKAVFAVNSIWGGPTVWVTAAVLVIVGLTLIGPAQLRARLTPAWLTTAESQWPLLRQTLLALWIMAVAGSLVNDYGVRIAMIALIPAVPLIAVTALQANQPASSDGSAEQQQQP